MIFWWFFFDGIVYMFWFVVYEWGYLIKFDCNDCCCDVFNGGIWNGIGEGDMKFFIGNVGKFFNGGGENFFWLKFLRWFVVFMKDCILFFGCMYLNGDFGDGMWREFGEDEDFWGEFVVRLWVMVLERFLEVMDDWGFSCFGGGEDIFWDVFWDVFMSLSFLGLLELWLLKGG